MHDDTDVTYCGLRFDVSFLTREYLGTKEATRLNYQEFLDLDLFF